MARLGCFLLKEGFPQKTWYFVWSSRMFFFFFFALLSATIMQLQLIPVVVIWRNNIAQFIKLLKQPKKLFSH